MDYFEVYKISSLRSFKGMELKKELPEDIKKNLLAKGFEETKTSFRIPISALVEDEKKVA